MENTRRKFLATTSAIAGSSLLTMPAIALGQKATKWRVQTMWNSGEPMFRMYNQFCEEVKQKTGGRLEITQYASGSIVGFFDTLDAVRQGILHGQSTSPAVGTGKEPALGVIGDFAFGYDTPMQQIGWLYERGGLDLMRELYKKFGIYPVGAVPYGIEALTSKVPIRRPEDFKGVRHRAAPGMSAEIVARMGASIVVLPGSEVYSALEKGVVSCVDWGTLSSNNGIGLFEIGKYANYPGFHAMPLQDFIVNPAAWAALPEDVRGIVEKTWRDFWTTQLKVIDELDQKVAIEIQKKGVELIDWSKADRARARVLAESVWADWAKKSPQAKQVVDSELSYLRELKLLA